MKNCGLFLNMAKWCFWGVCFWGFNIKRFVFGVSGIVWKVLKMRVFPSFGFFFLGWLIVVHLGLEGLGAFVLLVFVFLFLCCFCFCFVWFVLGFVVGCCCFFGCFFVCFFVVFFVGGFKGQVRWPKGPPHLALNPPYFMCFYFFVFLLFCFVFVFFKYFCLFFFEGLRVRWGGPKGHLTWP